MDQLLQTLKDGKMEILEVPCPALGKGQILVRNHYSVISAGTEAKTVSDARKGYLAKARSRQKEVKQVLAMVKSQGIMATYNMVMNKLEAPSPLGYSCAGEVLAVSGEINDIKPGDLVACGGQGAFHSDIVAVYRNLCVKLPQNMDLRHAAFTTVASIALQGIRQAEVQMGGNCVVIGLGLIGQLTIQLLNAGGIKATGIDIDPIQVGKAIENGASDAWTRDQEGLEQAVLDATGGYGADAVIITAGSMSTDPVELSGVLCRRKGKVVIVGAVPTGFSRENYYRKELDLRMSSSYGPGRYDPLYEEKGIDYPVGYVRWTENRNMQAIISLISAGKLNIDKIISHVFDLTDAPEAYSMIIDRKEPYLGILISYDTSSDRSETVQIQKKSFVPALPVAGLIGAGNFAQNIILPNLKGLVNFYGIATAHGNSSIYTGKKYGFEYCTSDSSQIIKDKKINTVFIVTRHNLHASQVLDALSAGKNVFVEKPLSLTIEELEKIRQVYESPEENPKLMVGYNRRFAPYTTTIMNMITSDQRKAINIRVNAGSIPREHWIQDPQAGGGRIIGEACHFIDLAVYIAGSPVLSVSAADLSGPENLMDSFSSTLKFRNGSIASIAYLSNGNKDVPKELIEVFCNGTVSRIDDFKRFEFYGRRKIRSKSSQDKGHKQELKLFTESITKGLPSPIPFAELYHSSLVTFSLIESIRTGRTIEIEHSF